MKGLTPAAIAALAKGDIGNFLVAATPGGVEAQEAQGQRDLVNSSKLPKEMMGQSRESLVAAGVVIGSDADDLFVNVTLPDGWKLVPTDHSMWSELSDETGKSRYEVFYKAAFYDRDAFIREVAA